VITYHAATPAYSEAIGDAVDAWNRSGARVRFRAASAARAQLKIRYGLSARSGADGVASLGQVGRGTITMVVAGGIPIEGSPTALCGRVLTGRPGAPGPRRQRVKCFRGATMLLIKPRGRVSHDRAARLQQATTVTHELGHVLGLQHNHPACSIMSYERLRRCPKGKPWQARCRLVERDDARGAVARYGGRMRPLAQEFCDVASPPSPPAGVVAKVGPGETILVSWNRVVGDATSLYRIAGRFGSCPASPPAEKFGARRRARQSHGLTYKSGRSGPYCVAVWHEDQFGRLAGPVSATVEVPVPPNDPPLAGFFASADEGGLTVTFSDDSRDPDGTIVAREWRFGDGATSAEADPAHTYASAGTYTVTLTVTDDRGATGTDTQTVTVAEPEPEPPPED
jgi:hypothetical protein